ncbi:NUDIX hydrolase [Leucobacter sp.]
MQYESISASERRYLPPAVAVSVVAFALHPPADAVLGEPAAPAAETTLWIPLVRRTRAPFQGLWALPGGPTQWDETLSDTALRTLRDAVLRDPGYLEQLYSFGGVERSAEAQRLVTIAYWALYGEHDLDAVPRPVATLGTAPRATDPADGGRDPRPVRRWDDPATPPQTHSGTEQGPPAAGSERDANVAWFSADRLPELAFDHAEIVAYALARLRSKTEYAAVAHRFLGPVFTLARLRAVYEAVLGESVDPANFRRQALAQGNLIDTGEVETGTPHRPARLYRFRGDPSLAGDPDRPGVPQRNHHIATRSAS